jgi:hypothetical protein
LVPRAVLESPINFTMMFKTQKGDFITKFSSKVPLKLWEDKKVVFLLNFL